MNGFLKLITAYSGHDQSDMDAVLADALECYVECGPGWADVPESFKADLQLDAEPAWEIAEMHLLVACFLACQALAAFEIGTKKKLILAAMLYADAIEARESWTMMRGPARARNQDTWEGKIQKRIRALDDELAVRVARTKAAKESVRTKLANDPKQAAKAHALELWIERHNGKHPKLRTVEQFATEVMHRWPVLTSSKVICGWSAKWTKEAKAGRTPAI